MSDTVSPTQSVYLLQAEDVIFESSNEKSHRNCPVSGIIQAKSALVPNTKNDRSDLATTIFEGEKVKIAPDHRLNPLNMVNRQMFVFEFSICFQYSSIY